MTTLTLESIEVEHQRLAGLIEQYRREQAEKAVVYLPEASIALKPGELYAGLMLGEDGRPTHHVILLSGDVAGMNWEDAKKWAQEQGGVLPSRREQSLLFANLKQHFESAWYWSAEESESNDAYAWSQHFTLGGQYGYRKSYLDCRARAFRRLEIQ